MQAMINSKSMEDVQSHFEQWRLAKGGRGRIPEILWSEAVALLSSHSITHVTKTLRLNPSELKRRKQNEEQASPFIELHFPDQDNLSNSVHSIEIEKADGTQMRIMPGENVDLSWLIRSFLECKS